MTFHIKIFSDHICPFCYIGTKMIEELKKDVSIEDEWVDFELHPTTPAEGILLKDKFQGANIEQMFVQLRQSGAPYGIIFGEQTHLYNTRLAIQASEFAKDHGKYHEFHEKVFYANFTDIKDISDIEVIKEIAKEVGLDTDELEKALKDGRYLPRLEEAQEKAQQYGVTGTPTFIINDKYKIVGAQSLDTFKRTLQQIENQEA
ncbi:DsbA family oxidoreductase [Brevibacillus daliensis]|uniref:DsbA family oxidoreductase n=1 Tax=Brevibacillus daliensis TaxID=2892995 RepID=UPI001E2920AA